MLHPRSSVVYRLIVIIGLMAGVLSVQPSSVAHAAGTKTGVPGGYGICVRPGGTSRLWTYGNDSTPLDPSHYYPITQISYYSVDWHGQLPNWVLWRGHFEYSTNGGSTWLPYTTAALGGNPVFVSVAGTLWHFVDTASSDTTTADSIGVAWFLQGWPNNVGSGTSITPDNPPTDITSDNNTILTNTGSGTPVATLSPTDTGCTTDGYWVIDSQSVPNLFTISFDAATGNSATLRLGSGSLPAAGQTATVTVRYYDLYQTDSSGNPIAGQGFSKALTFNIVADSTQDLNFSNDAAASSVAPVYSGYGMPSATTLSTGNYVTVWSEFGHGADAKVSNGTAYDYGGIYGRQFNSTGTATAAAFPITPVGDGIDEYEAAIAALNAGRYVATYRRSTASNGYDIGYRIVEANGTIGSELIANTTVAGDQTTPAIATLTDGSFVIAWVSAGAIHAQKFSAVDGSKNGSELVVHSNTTDVNPAIAALSNGNYAIAWADSSTGNVSASVSSAPGTVIPVISDGSSWGSNLGSRPHLVGLSGGFVVTWDSYANDMVGWTLEDIFFQRYTNAGAAQGAITRANTVSVGYMTDPGLAALSGGGFVIGWQSDIGDYDLRGIFGRRFTSTGTAVDANDFEINQYRKGDQIEPAMTPLSTDLFATVWEADASTYYSTTPGIYTRVLLPTGPTTVNITGSAGIAGATLSYVDGSLKTATADGSSNYTVTVSNPWSGIVTPTLTGYTFSPASRTYSNVSADQTGQNYAVVTCTPQTSGTVNWSVAFNLCPSGAKKIIPSGLNVVLDSDLSLGDDLEVQSGGTFDANGKTVTLTGTLSQTLTGNPLNFYNLIINKTNASDTVTVVGKLKVTKKLTITKGKLKSASDYGDVEIDPAGSLELTNDISVSGTWLNDGTFIANTAQVAFDGTTPQAIGGAHQTLFQRLVISPTASVFISTTPSVTDTVSNYGTLSQTQTVNNASVYFLQFSANKYRSVDLTTTDNLGQVSVIVKGNTTQCTGDAGSPAYRSRCFRVDVEQSNSFTADMTFYTTVGEDTISNDTVYQYYSGLSMWADVGTASCGATQGEPCVAGNVNLEAGSNYFLVGGTDSPTAVTLRELSAVSPLGTMSFLPIAVLVLALIGVGGSCSDQKTAPGVSHIHFGLNIRGIIRLGC